MPDALALDFDGVLCDGLKEYFQTALKAYSCLWSNPDAEILPRWEAAFGRLRPVVETGWEMPLVLRALDRGWSETAILSDWPQVRETLLSQESITASQLSARVDGLRDQWIAADLSSWLALHRFYPGVSGQLHHWVKQQFPIFIVTTKESRFVQALLEREGITLPTTAIFGKDCRQPKAQTLRQLQSQGFSYLWFVEDRWATLQEISQKSELQSVALFLADWGYNTQGDREAARTDPTIHLLSCTQFSQPLAGWINLHQKK